jgi:hypothetical protein
MEGSGVLTGYEIVRFINKIQSLRSQESMYPFGNYLTANQVNRHTSLNDVVSSLCWQNYQPITYIGTFKTTDRNSKTDIEQQLNAFISWVLRVTTTGEYSGDVAMELLDQAWMAQKLVWWLRESQSS